MAKKKCQMPYIYKKEHKRERENEQVKLVCGHFIQFCVFHATIHFDPLVVCFDSHFFRFGLVCIRVRSFLIIHIVVNAQTGRFPHIMEMWSAQSGHTNRTKILLHWHSCVCVLSCVNIGVFCIMLGLFVGTVVACLLFLKFLCFCLCVCVCFSAANIQKRQRQSEQTVTICLYFFLFKLFFKVGHTLHRMRSNFIYLFVHFLSFSFAAWRFFFRSSHFKYFCLWIL